jgi:hypothetical protein
MLIAQITSSRPATSSSSQAVLGVTTDGIWCDLSANQFDRNVR